MRIVLLLALTFATFAACSKDKAKEDKPAAQPTDSKKPALTPPGVPATTPADVPAPPDVAAAPADAQKTASGVAFKVLAAGSGTEHAEYQDNVMVHFTSWTSDGKTVQSTTKRGQPTSISLRRPPNAGLGEVLPLMVEGEKRRVWIPAELAKSPDPRAPQVALVYDLELVKIVKGPKPIPAPAEVAEPPKDAEKTSSGLLSKVIKKGTGTVRPGPDAYVEFHFTSWTPDGKMVDSTVQRGRPLNVQLSKTIPAWREGIPLMVVGEKRLLWAPPQLGSRPPSAASPPLPGMPTAMMTYEVELLNITEPPKAPPDVAAPPKDAKKTASGLASKVLKAGTGKEHPTAESTVEVHYSGWTTDGKMFDSSVVRGKPVKFQLRGVIPGWTEGVQLMVQGEKRRFWIPEELAYKGRPGAPQGMLVFDVELVSIVPAAAPPGGGLSPATQPKPLVVPK